MLRLSLGAVLSATALAAPKMDQVVNLPDFGTPPTPLYSGFLDASDGVSGTHLHYMFAESMNDPENAPVVLWLNGGPGSSSLLGFMQEVGPLLIKRGDKPLIENPYSWTNLANVIAIESPAGVGFSYCANTTVGKPCINTDMNTAAAARAAVVDFFKKFPELSKNKFYIAGESYAGVYVPTLAKEILDNAPSVNLVGVAVGDPCTDNDSQRQSMDMLWYSHNAGLIPDDEFEFLYNNCSARYPALLTQGKWEMASGKFKQAPPTFKASNQAECQLAHRKALASSSRLISQTWGNGYINDLSLYGPFAVVPFDVPGSLNYAQSQYLNRDDVKASLHVLGSPRSSKTWPGPDDGWVYEKQYDACNADVAPGMWSMIDFYKNIAPRLEVTNVFNGDTDPCVSYQGTRIAVQKVGFPEVSGGTYRPWFYNQTQADPAFLAAKPLLFGPDLTFLDAGPQFGGNVVNYQHNLNFITVHGSGHMVPQFRPQAAYQLLSKTLNNELLAPLFASDIQVIGMSDAAYDSFLDNWTVSAKSPPFVPACNKQSSADCYYPN